MSLITTCGGRNNSVTRELYIIHDGFSVTGGVDFSTKPLTITFMADESDPQHEISARISIMDDTVNEADQVFIVSIELEHALVNTSVWLDRRPSTLCRIVDNDCKYTYVNTL